MGSFRWRDDGGQRARRFATEADETSDETRWRYSYRDSRGPLSTKRGSPDRARRSAGSRATPGARPRARSPRQPRDLRRVLPHVAASPAAVAVHVRGGERPRSNPARVAERYDDRPAGWLRRAPRASTGGGSLANAGARIDAQATARAPGAPPSRGAGASAARRAAASPATERGTGSGRHRGGRRARAAAPRTSRVTR